MEEYLVSCFKVWDQSDLQLHNVLCIHQSTPLYTKNLELELMKFIFQDDVEVKIEKLRLSITKLHQMYTTSKENHEKFVNIMKELNIIIDEQQLTNFSSFVRHEYHKNIKIPLWFLEDKMINTRSLEDSNDILSNILTLHDSYSYEEVRTYEENIEKLRSVLRPIIEDNYKFNYSMSMLLYHYYYQLYSLFTKLELMVHNIIHASSSYELEEGEVVDYGSDIDVDVDVDSEIEEIEPTFVETQFNYAKIQVVN
jgi:hypothetical protein